MMILAKLSTAKTIVFGPVLDADGAEYTGAVVADVKISKNNGTPAALNGSATLTHKEVGTYELALTAADISAVGLLTVTLSKTTYVAPPIAINVLPAKVYDSVVAGTDNLEVDIVQLLGTASAGDPGYVGTDHEQIANPTATQLLTGTTVGDVTTLSAAQAEPGQGAPAVNASVLTKIAYLFKAWRNHKTQTPTLYSLYADN
jgi:hypothetical protein